MGSQGRVDYHSSSEKCSLFVEHNRLRSERPRETIFNWDQLRQGTFFAPWRTRKWPLCSTSMTVDFIINLAKKEKNGKNCNMFNETPLAPLPFLGIIVDLIWSWKVIA